MQVIEHREMKPNRCPVTRFPHGDGIPLQRSWNEGFSVIVALVPYLIRPVTTVMPIS